MTFSYQSESFSAGVGRPGRSPRSARLQLSRLFRVVVLLQSEPGLNARKIAERCEVSRRTVHRDLDLLAEAGIPVQYHPQEQGYRLGKGFFLQPPALTELEALALSIVVRDRSASDGLGLLRPALEGAVKVVQGLPPEIRERISSMTGTVRELRASELSSSEEEAVHQAIVGALARQRQVRLWYRSTKTLDEECTKFAVYRLLVHDHHWFLVGRSSFHRRVDVIGVPWISRAESTDDPYRIPPRFDLERFLAQAWGVERSPHRYRVRLRFSARAAPVAEETHRHRALRRTALAGGAVELEFIVDGLDEILKWVQGYGDEVEVVEPGELRLLLFKVAVAVANRHAPEPD